VAVIELAIIILEEIRQVLEKGRVVLEQTVAVTELAISILEGMRQVLEKGRVVLEQTTRFQTKEVSFKNRQLRRF